MFSKLTSDILDICLDEFRKKDNQKKIQSQVIDPIFCYIQDRLYPYIVVTCVVFFLILVLIILIFIMITRIKF